MDEITEMDSNHIQESESEIQRRNNRHTTGTEKNKNTTSSILATDILFFILLKQPERSLKRLQCVSKEFEALITDPIFITHRRPWLIIQGIGKILGPTSHRHFRISFPNVEEFPLVTPKNIYQDPYFIGSCHGLLCFQGFTKNWSKAGVVPCVYNSLTRRWISTPLIDTVGKFYVLYHRSSTDTYQILTFVLAKYENIYGVYYGRYMVHELGTASWGELPETGSYVPLRFRQTIHVAMFGCLYWICFSIERPKKRMIMSFDVETEQFKYIDEPPAKILPETQSEALTLIETSAGLGYPTFTPGTMDIWVMKGRNEAWTKDYVINLEPIQGSLRICPSMPSYVVLLSTLGEIWFLDKRLPPNGYKPKFTIYDCKHSTFRSVDLWSLIPDCFLGDMTYSVCHWGSSISLNAF